MDEVLYQSNKQKKILANKVEQEQFLKEKKMKPIIDAWEQAQIKAASIQSALEYAIEQYNQYKDELEETQQKEVEEQIEMRKKEVEDYLMAEKDKYLESIGLQAD